MSSSKTDSNTLSVANSIRQSPPQITHNPPLTSSSNNLTEAAFVGAITNTQLADSNSIQSSSLAPAAGEDQQATPVAAKTQEINEGFLNQIEKLAAETNALKKERRERILSFNETKKEYDATLKFAQNQHQEQLEALERENKILAEKLAAQGGSRNPDDPQRFRAWQSRDTGPGRDAPSNPYFPTRRRSSRACLRSIG